ncbi:hypothetical protein [uncultured Tateyamaria sp.]|uniref:hypothetical protein n=1 Tax=uncultured Tateyamaria sp. TaxID=455651 RepID=UPI002636BCE7|nr:hypothetical protein [uncultured Tateyamaria sp.]
MPEQSDQPDFPALSDDELRETLDLMATAVASMSDRIDALGAAADKQIKVSTEARIAAFAARDQTDPKKYGELIGQTVHARLSDSLKRLDAASADVLRGVQHAQASHQETTTAHSDTLRLMNEHRRERQKDRKLLPWVSLGAVVLALVLTVTLPRFMASNASMCAVLGATWTTTSTGVDACVFYGE